MATFPKLPQPVAPSEVFVAPATLDAANGRDAVRHAVKDGIVKPSDIDAVELPDPPLLYVPFWRVGTAFQQDGVIMVCARADVPYEPKLPTLAGEWVGPRPIVVGTNDLVPMNAENAREALARGEIVDADVDQARAEAIANGVAARSAIASSDVHAPLATTFCLYPLYYAPYRYTGESRRHAGEELYVIVSGRTGEVVAAKHPSVVRAMANKLRKLLSFDRR